MAGGESRERGGQRVGLFWLVLRYPSLFRFLEIQWFLPPLNFQQFVSTQEFRVSAGVNIINNSCCCSCCYVLYLVLKEKEKNRPDGDFSNNMRTRFCSTVQKTRGSRQIKTCMTGSTWIGGSARDNLSGKRVEPKGEDRAGCFFVRLRNTITDEKSTKSVYKYLKILRSSYCAPRTRKFLK